MKKILSLFLLMASGISCADRYPESPYISVDGIYTIQTVPDMLFMSTQISKVDNSIANATRSVERRSAALIDALKELGIKKEDITSSDFHIFPKYQWVNRIRVFQGSEVSRTINVTLRNLSKYGELIQAVIDADVAVVTHTQLLSSREEELRKQALVGAVKNAREKAQLLLSTEDGSVGSVYSITSVGGGPAPVVRLERTANASLSQNAFEPGVIEFRELVNVVFLIRRK